MQCWCMINSCGVNNAKSDDRHAEDEGGNQSGVNDDDDHHLCDRSIKLIATHADQMYGRRLGKRQSVTVNVQGELGGNTLSNISTTAEVSTEQDESPGNSPNAMESAGQTLINQCPICGRTFRHPSRLMRHQKSHTTHRDFKCNICARAYKYSFDLDDHMRKRHADASLPLRKSTREQIHASEQAGHPCPECGKQFKQWRTLRNHRRIAHPGTVNFVCEKCGMSFPRELHLKRHIKKMHEREDKRTCPDCGKSLTHSKNLSRHIKDVHKRKQAEETHVAKQQTD
ncbi:Zinc finger Y-chromosomal protein 2 [Clonorchis sinensis]|uniref:Zinc finger Y-chromosomal protein 2 n=1 Tax=Clonorchis sinensis TaxID=79923 RepID=A0A419QEN2_CLOSI|nr:Zinc finger Y-chromosomal protein 2 [Clonorchis sinensis]